MGGNLIDKLIAGKIKPFCRYKRKCNKNRSKNCCMHGDIFHYGYGVIQLMLPVMLVKMAQKSEGANGGQNAPGWCAADKYTRICENYSGIVGLHQVKKTVKDKLVDVPEKEIKLPGFPGDTSQTAFTVDQQELNHYYGKGGWRGYDKPNKCKPGQIDTKERPCHTFDRSEFTFFAIKANIRFLGHGNGGGYVQPGMTPGKMAYTRRRNATRMPYPSGAMCYSHDCSKTPRHRGKYARYHGTGKTLTSRNYANKYTNVKNYDCAARVVVSLKRCTSCCCKGGMSGSSVGLSLFTDSKGKPYSPTSIQSKCGAWLTTLDSLVRAIMGLVRATVVVDAFGSSCFS